MYLNYLDDDQEMVEEDGEEYSSSSYDSNKEYELNFISQREEQYVNESNALMVLVSMETAEVANIQLSGYA